MSASPPRMSPPAGSERTTRVKSARIARARSGPNISAFRFEPPGTVPVTQAAEPAGPPQSRLSFLVVFICLISRLGALFDSSGYCKFACDSSSIREHRSFLRSTDSGSADRISCRVSASRPPPTDSPLPLQVTFHRPPAGGGRQPVPVPGHGPARHGPARDVTSRVTASRWSRRGDVTRARDHGPPARPPGPLPDRCPPFGVRRCARAPTDVCQGLRALTQRSPRSGRIAAMRVQTREAHWRRGLAQPQSV